MKIISIKGKKIADYLNDIAHLRMTVFSEYPYLYVGDLDYERTYLKSFVNHKDSFCVLVFDGETIVGVSTAMPMLIADQAFQDCFNHDDIMMLAYFGESLLLKNYRYQGIGRTFFKLREDYSLQMGFKKSCFCAVDRPKDHALRPIDYYDLSSFWRSLGYHRTDKKAFYHWRDIGDDCDSEHSLTFWEKHYFV